MPYSNDYNEKSDSSEYFCEKSSNKHEENVIPVCSFRVTGGVLRKWLNKGVILTMLLLFIGTAAFFVLF